MPVITEPRKDKHRQPNGKMVTFYVNVPEGRKKGEIVTVNINGFGYDVVLGRRNTYPEEVVKVLKNCQSAVMETPGLQFQHAMGGAGRPQSEFFDRKKAQEVTYLDDYDIHIEKEG